MNRDPRPKSATYQKWLHLHVVDGLSFRTIGRRFNVGAACVSRQIKLLLAKQNDTSQS